MQSFTSNNIAVPLLLFAGLLGIVFAAFTFLLQTETYQQQPALLSTAMLIDLLIALPAAFWLVFRKSGLPAICIAFVSLAGFLFASTMLPVEQQQLVSVTKAWFFPILSVFVAGYFVMTFRKGTKIFQITNSHDHRERILVSVEKLLGKHRLTETIATEIAMFYYCFRTPDRWSSSEHRLEVPPDASIHSYHQKSGMATLLIGFLMAASIELAACHLFLAQFSHVAAWLASLSSAYAMVMILGQVRALKWRPIYIENGSLTVRNGMFELCVIPTEVLDTMERSRESIPKHDWDNSDKPRAKKLAPLNACFPDNHNLVIRLKQEWTANLLYGKTRSFKTLLLCIDEPEPFLAALSSAEKDADQVSDQQTATD